MTADAFIQIKAADIPAPLRAGEIDVIDASVIAETNKSGEDSENRPVLIRGAKKAASENEKLNPEKKEKKEQQCVTRPV